MYEGQSRAFGDLLRRHRIYAGLSQEELAAQAGLSARAISDLERGVKRVPRRDTVQLLVEALQLSGEAKAAFITAAREPAVYQGARPAIQVQTEGEGAAPGGVGPQPAVPSFALSAPLDRPSVAPPVGGFLGALPEGELVGREAERATLVAAVEAVTQARGQLAVVAGEPGVGKTRLAQEAMAACRERGFLVATGRCYEPHRAVPYYPFLEALSSLYIAAPDSVRAEIPTRWPALPRLLPDQPATSPAARDASPQEEQQRLFWAVTGFVQALGELAPVALLLDDLHWADDASLALLQHLARHTRTCRVLLLGIYRDVEVGRQHPLARALRDLDREHLVEHISLRRLTGADTARLVTQIMGQEISEAFAAMVHRHTDGNPLFVHEVLRTLIERKDVYRRDGRWERRHDLKDLDAIAVPETVRATIADRASRLSELAQAALREASVLGQAFTFEDLQAMGEHQEAALDAALEEALAAGLVQESGAGEGYVFNHALTQQALYAELSVRQRRRLHLAAGEALDRLPQRVRERRAAELAWHFREGGASERALPYALLAGEQAQALYATEEAERHYRTALELATALEDHAGEAHALEKLGWLLWLLARFDASAETLERAAGAYRALGDADGEVRTVGQLGMLYYTVEPLEGVRRITSLLDRLDQQGGGDQGGQEGHEPSKPLASLHVSLALNLLILGRYPETAAAAERGAEMSRALGDTRMAIWAEMTRGPAIGLMGRLEEARRLGDEAIPVAEAIDDYYGVLSAVHYLGAMCVAEGDFAAAQDYYKRALELAERLGARSRISAETANLAEVCFYLGAWERAGQLLQRALHIARTESPGRTGSFFQYAHVFRQLGALHAAVGDWEVARPYLEEAVARAELLPYPEALRGSQGLLAEHDLVMGHPDAALARLEPLIAGSETGELGIARLLPTLAQARAALGDVAEAERILAEGIARTRTQGHRLALVDLLRAHGVVLDLEGRRDAARSAVDESLSLARDMRYPYAEGRALHAQGRLHAATGQPDLARARLDEALAIFRRLGARPDVERTARTLAALGAQ